MKELIVEIGVEEIPSGLILFGMKALESLSAKLFKESRLDYEGMKSYGTPRRLILHVAKLSERQSEYLEEVIGPPWKLAYDEKGKLTRAGTKFAEAHGVSVRDLKMKKTPKGEYLSAIRRKPVLRTEAILKNSLAGLLHSLNFPKSMVWGPSKVRFVRPVRWTAAVYGGRNIPFRFGEIKSAPLSYGHRFMAPKPLKIKDFKRFQQQLKKQFVLIDPTERRKRIVNLAERLGKRSGGKTAIGEEYLEQAVYLTEFPVVFRGEFDVPFLNLPQEIILNALCEHQGYFPVFDTAGDRLLPLFVAVSNLRSRKPKVIQNGNERVLRSRLSDAQFYFESDLKVRLEDRAAGLARVVYQENLGTLQDRVSRLSRLSEQIAAWTAPGDPELSKKAARAGLLSKTDLLTGVVREFPKLQGIIGKEYALRQGEDPEIAKALEEQYLPRSAGGDLPESRVGKILSLADKMDTLTGSFGLGRIPTGSEDPFALRRQATGLIQILWGYDPLPFNLTDLVSASVREFRRQGHFQKEIEGPVLDFLRQRYEFILESRGYRADIIRAVTAVEFKAPAAGEKRIAAIQKYLPDPGFKALLTAYKRLSNILPKNDAGGVLDAGRLTADEEKRIHQIISGRSGTAAEFFRDEAFEALLNLYLELTEPLDRFFTAVMVNDPDPVIRENRLALVRTSLNYLKSFADFSKIVTES
jgi:glycyl-tRNA synthetase beta chain